MTGYDTLTATEIRHAKCTDLGVTYREGDYSERTIIVRGALASGAEIAGAVLVDADGKSMPSPSPFAVGAVENFEMAASIAAEASDRGAVDSYRGLLQCDFRTVAEQYVAKRLSWPRGEDE